MGKIEEKKKEKKQALLEAAFELYTEKGVDNTSISEIVKQAQMAKGTFYLYFKDKYEVQNYLIAYHANRIFQNAYERLNHQSVVTVFTNAEDAVVFLVDSVIEQLESNLSLMRFISKNLSWGMFSEIQIRDRENRTCLDVFNDILQEYPEKYRQKELMIYMIVEFVSATCYNVLLNQEPVSVEVLKPEIFQVIRSILAQFAENEKEIQREEV